MIKILFSEERGSEGEADVGGAAGEADIVNLAGLEGGCSPSAFVRFPNPLITGTSEMGNLRALARPSISKLQHRANVRDG